MLMEEEEKGEKEDHEYELAPKRKLRKRVDTGFGLRQPRRCGAPRQIVPQYTR